MHGDIETRSEVDLRSAGVYRYSEHSSTQLNCFGYRFDHETAISLWVPRVLPQPIIDGVLERCAAKHPTLIVRIFAQSEIPADLFEHIEAQREFRAHNGAFERVVLNGNAGRALGFPEVALRTIVCTAAKMAASGLPRALDDSAEQLDTPRKDEGGRIDMLRLSKPRKPTQNNPARWWTPETAPEKFINLYCYNIDDVLAECGVDAAVPDLSKPEQEIYWLDQVINDRGVAVDVETVHTVQKLVDDYRAALEREMVSLVGFKPSQREKVADWLRDHGVRAPDLQAETVQQLLKNPELAAPVRRVLLLYSTFNAKATAKYDSIAAAVCADGRLHGMFMYHGAGTGRWTSHIVQLQNLARPVIEDTDAAIECLQLGDLDWLRANYPKLDPLKVIASCTRGMLTASPGKTLVFPDYAGIEARYNAWLFGEEWKLQAFRDYDTILGYDADGQAVRKGPDLYVAAYARAFQLLIEQVTTAMRQIGKVMELALGYEGGVGAFVKMAQTYRLNLAELAAAALPILPEDARESAEWMWGKFGARSGLEHDVYVACDGLKYLWRRAHPSIKAGWRETREAAEMAVQHPGEIYTSAEGRIRFKMAHYKNHSWLCLRLPSGRVMRYFNPSWTEARVVRTPTGFDESDFIEEHVGGELKYWGVDTETRRYEETSSYGGKWVENAVQGGCADILRRGLVDLSRELYPVVGHVHDEPICEVAEDFGSEEELRQILCAPLEWAPGLPLAIENHTSRRYRK